MATLAADIAVVFNPSYPIGLGQFGPTGTDIYFRGGLAHKVVATGKCTLAPADADPGIGVVMEHKSATTADLIWIATSGIFNFACANFTDANQNGIFAQQSTDLTDNPASLDVVGAGDAGAMGKLVLVDSTGVSGWLNLSIRIADSNS